MSKDRYLSEAALKDKPVKRFTIKIKDASITDKKLADGSITTTKLSDKSITSEKIADNAIGTAHIKSKAITSERLDGQAVLISKIADEVWNKLKNEYLRLDGKNSMNDSASIGFNNNDKAAILSKYGLSLKNGNVTLTEKGLVFDYDESSYTSYDDSQILFKTSDEEGDVSVILFKLNGGEMFAKDNVSAKGFKTNDRTNIGLLVNDGSVGLAMTDSDIDAITSSVFTNYVNAD